MSDLPEGHMCNIIEETTPQAKTRLKLHALNDVGQDIHPAITFVDGKLTCQLQVGHPGEEGSKEGCFGTHLIDFCAELHKHYNTLIRCRETSIAITNLETAWLFLMKRKLNREKRGVLQTDKD